MKCAVTYIGVLLLINSEEGGSGLMVTIVEPQKNISNLWGIQPILYEKNYRLMQYVLRVDYDGRVLLHNVVTGRLVVLTQIEADLLDKLPTVYKPSMKEMVEKHFLVPNDYDEHKEVYKLRTILRRIGELRSPKEITHYTILPTTSCNARCYYCFEQGSKIVTMTEQTANEVVEFISRNSGDKSIHIAWFGGEPTVAAVRIDQICEGLNRYCVKFYSSITTNGYLFDEEMVHRAKGLWNLKYVNISMDGTEEKYNIIKSFINPKDNPYQRVMKNIGVLIDQDIRVNLRMNFDMNNFNDFQELLKEILGRFGNTPLISVSAHQVNGSFPIVTQHGSEEWFSAKIVELNDIARAAGVYRRKMTLPSLVSLGCKASLSSTVTITAEGNLVRCPEQFGDDQITGNVREGVINRQLVLSWKQLMDNEKCVECVFYPKCLKILNCSVGDQCTYKMEYDTIVRRTMIKSYVNSDYFINTQEE